MFTLIKIKFIPFTIFTLYGIISFSLQLQSQKVATFEDLIYGGMWTNTPRQFEWIDNENCSYMFKGEMFEVDSKGKSKVLFTPKQLSEIVGHEISSISQYKWEDENKMWFASDSSCYWIHISEKKLLSSVKLLESVDSIHYKAGKIAYSFRGNVYIASSDGVNVKVTENKPSVRSGVVPYRNEFGGKEGNIWSNSAEKLLFYTVDERKVPVYPLVDYMAEYATVIPLRYPFAGGIMEKTDMFIYDTKKQNTVQLQTRALPYAYYTNISWTPDDTYITTFALNRGQDSLSCLLFNAETGKLHKKLFEITDRRYVEPECPPLFIDGENFLFLNEKDGYNHFYKANINSSDIIQLTKGEWEVFDYLNMSDDKSFTYFSGNSKKDKASCFVYQLNNQTGGVKILTPDKGVHNGVISPNGAKIVDSYSTPSQFSKVEIGGIFEKKKPVLFEVLKPDEGLKYPTVEFFSLKSPETKESLYGKVLKPADFSPDKKYPVVIYVYNGPHLQLVTNDWLGGFGVYEQLLATKGYIVYSIDGRGSYGYGFDFESIIHRQNGIPQLQDQLQLLDYIKKQPFVDTGRIGVLGWSFGGYMTINMMVHSKGDVKAGVAGAPVTDWRFYEVMYGERYMDTPAENTEGYKKTSLLNKAKYLKGDLLIINGGVDYIVVPQNSMQFIQNCVTKNIAVDYFYYPPHDHHVRGRDRLHLIYKITNYFDENL